MSTTVPKPERPAPPAPQIDDRVRAALTAAPPDPSVGDVWRARWGSTTQLVLLTEVGPAEIEAVPLTPDVALIDEAAVVIDCDELPVPFDVAAWSSLSTELPVRVLDAWFGSVQALEVDRVRSRRGEGARILSRLDERAQVVEAISERIELLADASWVPAGERSVDVAEAMRGRGLTPAAVAEAVDIQPGEVIEIVRGDRAISPHLLSQMASVLGVDPADLAGSHQLDPDLILALDFPRFRHRLAERGRQEHVTDEAAWRFTVATQRLPVAARTTGQMDPLRRYIGLIEDFLGGA